jgi:YD repeat-containing protein
MRRILSIFLLITPLLATLAVTRADAQNNYLYGTGNPTWSVNIPIENGFINVANGNVHIEIPIGNEPQRGSLPLTETLVYDSRMWQIVSSGSSYSFQSEGGWSIGGTAYNGAWSDPKTFVNESVQCSGSGGSQGYLEAIYSYVDPSGTTHIFTPGIYSLYDPICPYGNTGNITDTDFVPLSATTTGYALDGSGYYMMVNNQTGLVFDQNGNSPGNEDRNGNYIVTTYTEPPTTFTFTDTLSNNAFVDTEENSTTRYLDVMTIGGAQKRYTITWENINAHTDFAQSGVTEYSGPISVVHSLSLPDGSTYTFNYDTGTASGYYGELTSMTLPTGGMVNFGYQNYLDSYHNENRWLNTYSGGSGSYTFVPKVVTSCYGSTDVGCQEQMTVTDGNSNQVVYLFTLNNGAWNSQTDYYNYVNGALPHVLSTVTNYNFQKSCPVSVCGGGAQWITASSTTTTLSDTGQTSTTKYVYNNPQYGKPDKVQTWDYSTPANCTGGNTPTKETDYTYGYFVNGAAYVTQVNRLDCNGNLAAQTKFNYDKGTLAATSGLPNHLNELFFNGEVMSGGPSPAITLIAPLGNRGNLTSVVSGTTSTVTTSSTYDDAGTKVSDTDANGNLKTYSTMCSDAFQSGVTYPIKVNGISLQSSNVYDCSSGLVTSTKDVNSQQTTNTYFMSGANLGRLQTVTRPDGGSKTYAYPSTTETDQTVAQSSSVNVTHESILDECGRSYQSVTVAPEGSISSETAYDATGRPYSVTTPHLEGTNSSTDGTSYTYYDVLGRTTKVTAPDHSMTTSTYSGNTQTVTDALSHSEQYTYDAFHRLTRVLEPNSSGLLTNETDYQYNALDKITQVDQWGGAKGSTSPGDRQRLFNYSDSLGRLHSMTTPEGGTTTFSYLTSGSPCAGNVSLPCSKTDARGVTTQYTYDALNRITSKSYSNDSSGTLTSCFQYDTSAITGAGGNLLGHLTNQWTQKATAGACNSGLLTSGGYQTLRSILSYDGVGRPLSAQQCTPSNCSSTVPYALTYGYDLAGNLTYYTNGLASTPGAGSSPLTFTQSFDSAGRLQNVMSTWSDSSHPATLFSAPTYAPPGALSSVLYGNGINLGRVYNNQLLPSSEIDTASSSSGSGSTVAVPGSATVTVTGVEQSK